MKASFEEKLKDELLILYCSVLCSEMCSRSIGWFCLRYLSLSLITVPVDAVRTAALFDLLPLQKLPYIVSLCKRGGRFYF